MDSNKTVWFSASLAAGHIVFLPEAKPAPEQPGTLREQKQIAVLAADNPWGFVDPQDAYHAARRTILHHARRVR